ncbi:protein FAM216A isoform X3 [Rhinoderma darwinii]|uniref:protein FAM216A isoform X3 n=1 Tax=Rhinoderma darwinii TaxID=43563 RepID=UPI003F666205
MERHTTSNYRVKKISSDKRDQKKLSHKDLEDGVHDHINSKDSGTGCRSCQTFPLRLQVKTIKIPKAMKNEAFLKHPELTMGQKRYLCSIARIYSTSNMRALTEKHQRSQIRCDSKKVHLNPPSSGKRKNEIKGHCRRVHAATTTNETSRTIEEMREQISCLSMNQTNCDGQSQKWIQKEGKVYRTD